MPTDAKAGTVVSIMLGCPEARSVLCPTLVACTACTRLCLLSDGSGIARHECTLPPLTIRHSRLARYVAEADYVLLAVWVGGAADGLGARRAAALRRQLVLAHALGCAGVLVICTSSPGLHRPSSAEGPGAGPGPGGEGHGPGAVGEGAGGAGGTAQWSGGEGAAGREGVPPADGASVAAPTPPSPTRLQLQALVREAGFGDGAVWWCTGEAWLRPGTLRHLRPVPVDARPPARVALTSVGGGWQGMRLGGRLWSGALKMGDMVVAAPAQRGHTTTGQLTYLYNGGQMGDGRAGAGALVDFEVANSGTARHLRKGQLLGLIKDAPPVSARAIRGRVQVVPPAPADGAAAPAGAAGGRGLRVGQSLLLCAHAARVQVRVAALAAPGPGERAPCRLEPGEAGVVVLVLARKAAMEVVADYPRLGRFVLMQGGDIVAAGGILTVWYVFPHWRPKFLSLYPPRYQQLAVTVQLCLARTPLPAEVVVYVLRHVDAYDYEGQPPWRGLWAPCMGYCTWARRNGLADRPGDAPSARPRAAEPGRGCSAASLR